MKIFAFFLTLALSATVLASPSPFNNETEARFKALEQSVAGGTLNSAKILVGNSSNVATARTVTGDVLISNTGVTSFATPTGSGNFVERMAKVVYDTSISGGTAGAHTLGVTLPAGAIITQSFFYTVTQFSGASGTVALSCEDANNILTATDITGIAAGTITSGASTGTAATMKAAIAADCLVTATVATTTQVGKLILFVRYLTIN